jgi:acetyl esterase
VTTDYAALRERRLAQVDDETRRGFELATRLLRVRELGVDGFRKLFAELAGQGTLAPGVAAKTTSIPGPASDVLVRIYRPDGGGHAERPLGVYLHTHGGGWIAGGGLDTFDAVNSGLALSWNCAVVHPDFRLPPEHRFPAAVEDCWATVEWIHRHGADHGLDSSRIAVGGGCTGANLAAVIALMARDAGGPKIALQLLDSPQLDTRCDYRSQFECAEGYGLTHTDDLFVVEQYLGGPEDRWDWRASPILAESVRGVAPAVVTAGEYEILRDEARLYAGRLRDAGVEVHYVEGKGQGHGFLGGRNVVTGEFTRGAVLAQATVWPIVRRLIGSTPTHE